MPVRTEDTVFAVVTLLLMALALGILVRELWRRRRETDQAQPDPGPGEPVVLEAPRCSSGPGCGQLATEQKPRLARGRGSVIRDYLGMPPTYRRVVDRRDPVSLCSTHAHVADSKMAAFTAEQKASFMREYALVAQRAAVFEQEDLPRMLAESLTPEQVKNARRSVPVNGLALVRKNGSDDA